ncbi:uncharacterized protein LOC119114642 [Pollicipes pollicipes]|uniref:uncharacterized protein LOC119114642 n=1 Tax=Pollicipes pollicipes TaxID=41117 RepID=UPI001885839D|nr:uncharacterized protein LOC119114642 [Pollicipes pollicipes]
MDGVRDYNHSANINSMTGTCQMECGKDTGSFEFTAYVKDANTATPKFSLPTYTVHVPEMFPKGLALPNSAIFASDADAEPQTTPRLWPWCRLWFWVSLAAGSGSTRYAHGLF